MEYKLEEEGKVYNIRHRCFYFSKDVIKFVHTVDFDKLYFSIFDQLIRAATSIGANVIEGKAGISKKDWIRFLSIALKSANETKYWLCLIRDTQQLETETINKLIQEATEISNIIASIIINANKN